MARPLKDPSLRMETDLRIPLTVEQKRLVASAANAKKKDMAGWLRPIILRAAHKALDDKADDREQTADDDINAGRVRRFSSVEDMITDLKSPD